MGHTVILLSPWDVPTPLTRAWCMWELYCTVEAGAVFSVCLGPAERAAFEAAVFSTHGFEQMMGAFAAIDLSAAQAGDPEDLAMILGTRVTAWRACWRRRATTAKAGDHAAAFERVVAAQTHALGARH